MKEDIGRPPENLELKWRCSIKTSYNKTLDSIVKKFRDELILPIQQNPNRGHRLSPLANVLATLPDQEENAYLQEAVGCATAGFLRGAVVLGWCGAINRIHLRIQELGFEKFNVTSASMSSQQKGRFKRFNQIQNISSLSELRQVFDTIVLWIIEGMELIDSNQHTRLRGCFEMRCQCGHPGEAPITEYNLMSFFSDIENIVFHNPNFKV